MVTRDTAVQRRGFDAAVAQQCQDDAGIDPALPPLLPIPDQFGPELLRWTRGFINSYPFTSMQPENCTESPLGSPNQVALPRLWPAAYQNIGPW